MRKKIYAVMACFIALVVICVGCVTMPKALGALHDGYTIKQLDLTERPADVGEEYNDLYGYSVIDDASSSGEGYMGHPDSVLLKDNQTMATFYPTGHGKGALKGKTSTDGKTWTDMTGLPNSWQDSRETPTVYKLDFSDANDGKDTSQQKFVLISGCPKWGGDNIPGNGFNASTSEDGYNWSEFTNFYGRNEDGSKKDNYVAAIVAMASLTRLKANGNWIDSWMGLFHDKSGYNYKSILTFDSNGNMNWSTPEKYLSKYRDIEKKAFLCEVTCIRSDGGNGNELMIVGRSNGYNRNKSINSLMSVSKDEGKTWSEPRELPVAINGERHKPVQLADGRIFMTFRAINRETEVTTEKVEHNGMGKGAWYSEGWVAWVGTYEDLLNGKEGQYRIKLQHTYLNGQTGSALSANGDTGYCGNVLMANGNIMTSTYGRFEKDTSKTIVVSKVINMKQVDELIAKLK